jgi:tetratricopeptide (TPR) repeat protein
MRFLQVIYAALLANERCLSLEPVKIQPRRRAVPQHTTAASLEPVRIAHRRRAVLQHTTAALLAAATTAPANANIGGADYVIGGARLSEAITNPEGQVEARLPRDEAEALARAATDYGSIGEAFAAEDGAAAQQIQAYFRNGGGYDALADSIQAVTKNKEAYPKSVRKAGGAFLAATAATLESYNTGDFEKALVQYESALTILAGYCARVGVIAGAPVAKPAKGPVTRRTYLPGPFQLM